MHSAGGRTASHAGEMALAASTDLQAALIARPSAPEAMLTSRMMSQNLKKAAAVGRSPACLAADASLCLGGKCLAGPRSGLARAERGAAAVGGSRVWRAEDSTRAHCARRGSLHANTVTPRSGRKPQGKQSAPSSR